MNLRFTIYDLRLARARAPGAVFCTLTENNLEVPS
jgi:hypothetical protein